MKNITEGPLEGAESAALYKNMTPGQEDADNTPYAEDEEKVVSAEMQAIMAAVSNAIRGLALSEAIVNYAGKWSTIKPFLEKYEEEGIQVLTEHCIELSNRTGKPLRTIVPEYISEEVNPDELIDDQTKLNSDFNAIIK